jgi:hypothetical protein
MDEQKIESMPITKQPSLPTQKKASTDMTKEEIEKEKAEIESKIAEKERQQQLIDEEFVYFEKCPIRYIETKDDNGNEIKGYKNKEGSTPEEKFKTLNKLTATQDIVLSYGILDDATSAQPQNKTAQTRINTVNQVLADYEPKDSIEAKLILQEHTLYSQGMQYLARAENSNKIPQCDFFMKYAIKLFRLHNETVEALNRHRRGSEQRIIVQHQNVTIENGAQGIVNNGLISTGGGEK